MQRKALVRYVMLKQGSSEMVLMIPGFLTKRQGKAPQPFSLFRPVIVIINGAFCPRVDGNRGDQNHADERMSSVPSQSGKVKTNPANSSKATAGRC
ncbi:hypothetical protein KCP78_18930 [Salmonella enterica subsp. enterica]|nr:hypothetical protein KCP78_18930 [Salmonella enterica subsp. enterica]